MSACCGPSRPGPPGPTERNEREERATAPPVGLVAIAAGAFRMGSDDRWTYPGDGETPVHRVDISPFRIASTTVTNLQYAEFVDATGHVTDAHRYGWSFVFAGFLPDDFEATRAVASAPWWRQVYGADWSHPEGPQSNVDDRSDHPVVHVSWRDADAYCRWRGVRLPTEAEWEYAARGGFDGAVFPWGDDLVPDHHRMNVWQGTFPTDNTLDDGYFGTAPVDAFAPNDYGLYNMTGNVWEWCADWYDPGYYARSAATDPKGPERGEQHVMRGGSYLCHESYCRRCRVAARGGNSVDSTTGNIGFRIAGDGR